MRIITWNVNSIRTRLARLLAVLERHEPDVVCLQELKVVDENFPALDLKQAGYHSVVLGQKTYNGVAILSRHKPRNVTRSLGDDAQARLIGADCGGLRLYSVYVPNGGSVGSEKWEYKLDWLARLRRYLDSREDPAKPLALGGDFNVAPDDSDVRNLEKWSQSVLCHPEARAALQHVVDWGLVDAFREKHPDGGIYSWWDYRMLGFPKNDGLRIDGVYVTEPLEDRILEAVIDRDERKGKQPSDHAPVIIDLAD
jgi:exodeoxyribonuclease-3